MVRLECLVIEKFIFQAVQQFRNAPRVRANSSDVMRAARYCSCYANDVIDVSCIMV